MIVEPLGRPWLLQEFIPGQTICLHALAHRGVVRAVVMYHQQFVFELSECSRIGMGCVYAAIEDGLVREVASRLIASTGYSGHIGLDMVRHGAEVYCVDINPRATGGLHLLEFGPNWLEQLCKGQPVVYATLSPCRDLTQMLSRALTDPAELIQTLAATSNYREVTHRRKELLASLLQLLIYGYFLLPGWLTTAPAPESAGHTRIYLQGDLWAESDRGRLIRAAREESAYWQRIHWQT